LRTYGLDRHPSAGRRAGEIDQPHAAGPEPSQPATTRSRFTGLVHPEADHRLGHWFAAIAVPRGCFMNTLLSNTVPSDAHPT
ncbi:hypothetical protein AB0N06_35995, partial [Streptomyces sp. NPDC051020]